MSSTEISICVVCAWRATCQKKFSIKAGQRCPEFVRDITIREEPAEEEKTEKKEKGKG
ncbi:MAG: hypothetical protein AB1478_08690 [Nitrospirota bacterium]